MGVFLCWSMKLTLFFLLLASAAVFGQIIYSDFVEVIVIDDFTNGANSHSVTITLDSDVTATDPDVVGDSSFDAGAGCSGLIGCERDMSLTIILGLQGRSFSSDIFTSPASYYFDAEWAISNPKNSESETILQYDGRDDSIDLDLNGLGSFDLTGDGQVEFLRISAVSDLDTEYVFTAYSPNGNTCVASLEVLQAVGAYNYYDSFVFFDIDDFSGNCDLENIGAIEVSLFSNDALDAIVRQIAFIGEDPSSSPTPSRTRTPSPGVSDSRTPTPTPSPTVTPSPAVSCECDCPIFQCGLIYAVPGDDDDNVDDDTYDDDDIVYVPVYYGPVDDDFDKIIGDDDEDEFISFHGGLTVDHNDDDDETDAASALATSLAVLVVVVAAIL